MIVMIVIIVMTMMIMFMSQGAELATISSQAQQDAVFSLTGATGAWLGLTDFLNEGTFSWVRILMMMLKMMLMLIMTMMMMMMTIIMMMMIIIRWTGAWSPTPTGG